MTRGADMTKILVIDDDAIMREVMTSLFEDAGYVVIAAEDGRRGVARFREERPDIVITDLIMPEQEGLQTIVELRRLQPDAKIIAVSGGGRIGDRDMLEMAQALGASDTVAKPFDPDDLVRRVSRYLASANAS